MFKKSSYIIIPKNDFFSSKQIIGGSLLKFSKHFEKEDYLEMIFVAFFKELVTASISCCLLIGEYAFL